MFRDRAQEALQAAAVTTLHRIRTEAEGLRPQLATLVHHVAENLFDPDLNVSSARRATGIRDQSLSTILRDSLGKPLRIYIEEARMEVAERLLRTTDHEIGRISQAVGFACHSTFLRAFVRVTGKRPSDVRGPAAEPAIDYATWYRTFRGELDDDEARRVLEAMRRLYPEAESPESTGTSQFAQAPRPVDVDGADFERYRAKQIWQEIRDLSPALQKQVVGLHRFHSPAFFDLLRNESRRQGRRDRQRGIALAELALESLEGCDDIFGERIHDLRALGWAWLGNAHAIELDFSAADNAFRRADAEWKVARRDQELLVLASIFNFRAKLRMFQRRYDESLELADRARTLFQHGSDPLGEARALILFSAILGYSGKLEGTIDALRNATRLVEAQRDSSLPYAIAANLANNFARMGRFEAAAKNLERARSLLQTRDYPMGRYEIRWLDADIKSGRGDLTGAEEAYMAARSGFVGAEDLSSVALLDLDLAVVNSRHRRWDRVMKAASDAIPLFAGLKLHTETVAALDLLSRALGRRELSEQLLSEVRSTVQLDPWTKLGHSPRTGRDPVL